MTIWIGYDGTLNDDEGDGPAVAGDPMQTFVGQTLAESVGYDGFVGQDDGGGGGFDFGSALSSLGTAAASAFGGSGGGGGAGGAGGGGGGFDFGSAMSSLSSAFGGSGGGGGGSGGGGDTGSAIANIFGQVAKAAAPVAERAISQAMQQHPSQQAQQTQQLPQHPSQQAAPPAAHPQAPRGKPAVRQKHAMDPKARLNLVLTHLAKQYGMPPPEKSTAAQAGAFMNDMMKGPGSTPSGSGGKTVTGALFDDGGGLLGAIRRFFSPRVRIVAPRSHYLDYGRNRGPIYGHGQSSQYSYDQGPGYGYGLEFGYGQPHAQQQYAQQQYVQQQYPQHAATTYHPQAMPATPVTYHPYEMPASKSSVSFPPIPPHMQQVSATWQRPSKSAKGSGGLGGHGGGGGYGIADERIREAQRLMNAYWHYPFLVEDGILGTDTIRYLTEFQRQQGLPQTGRDDDATHALLLTHPLAWPAGTSSDDIPTPVATEALGTDEVRTGIQSTSMYSPHNYYTDSYGAYVLPCPEGWW
jgi:hypothetical protein